MSVLLETSLGDLLLELQVKKAPRACTSFIKLCKIKYFNDALFFNVQPGFSVSVGDPSIAAQGKLQRPSVELVSSSPSTARAVDVKRTITHSNGGDSIYGLMYGEQARVFSGEITSLLTHAARGTVSMLNMSTTAASGTASNTSAFFITLADDLKYLDGKHCIFARVVDGLPEFASKLSTILLDESNNNPRQNIKIRHTIILEDPFPDPPLLASLVPPVSPLPLIHSFDYELLTEEDRLETDQQSSLTDDQIQKQLAAKEARSKAVVLEMLGDLPSADIKPPENVIFVCKLNPITRSEDLELLFSQFGEILGCDVIRDWKTNASLQYAFIEFAEKSSAERAYVKMNNALVDERRIKVDFSQSVSKQWNDFRRREMRKKAGLPPVPPATSVVARPPGSGPIRLGGVRPQPPQAPPTQAPQAQFASSLSNSNAQRHENNHTSSSRSDNHTRSRSRDRDRERDRDRDRDRDRNRDRDRSRSRSRDRHRSRPHRSSRDRSREKHHSGGRRSRSRSASQSRSRDRDHHHRSSKHHHSSSSSARRDRSRSRSRSRGRRDKKRSRSRSRSKGHDRR